MKLKTLLLTALAAAGLANMASAQTTVIDVTGATAFRGAAVTAIRNSFTTVQYGFTGTNFTGATQHIFVGTFPNIPGTTIVRTFWSGSTEGARDVVGDVTLNSYLPTNSTVSANPGTSGLATGTAAGTPEFYFSDVGIENTVYSATGVNASDDTRVGAIVFSMVKNESADARYALLTNVTSQQFRSLFSPTTLGRVRLSQFTGDNADDTKFVYATGRNDFSGTRTVYLAETGFGAPNLVAQWKMTSDASNNITLITLWPTGDNTGPDNRSLQWTFGNDIEGNGGYFSGGTLAGQLDDTSSSVDVKLQDGTVVATAASVLLISSVGNSDAAGAITGGAVALTYNGVGITPNASGLSAADKAKIQNGSYTLWSFERFYKSNEVAPGSDLNDFYTTVFGNISANIGSAGLTMGEMTGVVRATDGGDVFAP